MLMINDYFNYNNEEMWYVYEKYRASSNTADRIWWSRHLTNGYYDTNSGFLEKFIYTDCTDLTKYLWLLVISMKAGVVN